MKICDFGLARYYRKRPKDLTEYSKGDVASKLLRAEDRRHAKKRELSNHVVSRWYRAPEVILLERYNQKID